MKKSRLLKFITIGVLFNLFGCESTKVEEKLEEVDLTVSSDLAQVISNDAQLVIEKADGTKEIISLKKNDSSYIGELDPNLLKDATEFQVSVDVPELQNVTLDFALNDNNNSGPSLELNGITFTNEIFGEVEVSLKATSDGVGLETNNDALNFLIAAAGFAPGKEVTTESIFNSLLECSGYAPSIVENDSLAKVILQQCLANSVVDKPETFEITDLPLALACSQNIGTILNISIPSTITTLCATFKPEPKAAECATDITTINFKKIPAMGDLFSLYTNCIDPIY